MELEAFPVFTPPAFLANLNLDKVLSLVFVILFILWALYTLITAYHWLRYGHRSLVAIPALLTHVIVSFLIASFAVSGLTL